MIHDDPTTKDMGYEKQEWVEYPKTGYEKHFCNIRLKDGSEYGPCWPNAGKFAGVCSANSREEHKESEVTHIQYLL